jgi:hypothetical protein
MRGTLFLASSYSSQMVFTCCNQRLISTAVSGFQKKPPPPPNTHTPYISSLHYLSAIFLFRLLIFFKTHNKTGLFVPGVGAVPPEFLTAYTFKNTNVSAPDMYGNEVSCDYWSGPDGFKYWTVDHYDDLYKNWGHDILFQDGSTGVTWRWGNFNVEPQDDSLFQLPQGADCNAACSKTLSKEDHDALEVHVRLSRFGYGL